MNRTPPASVTRVLAEEVGFGCPVEGCGSPYLHWHHFDPPWAVEQHHRPEDMIALCRDHHPEADAGSFTNEQLRHLKVTGRDRNRPLGAKFNWMREKLLAVVGGNFYYEVPIAVQVGDTPVVWFNRDPEGRLLVNLRALTTSDEERIQMFDNFWVTEGSDEREITCPPSGRLVRASYPNGDRLSIEFVELGSLDALDRRFPPPSLPDDLRRRLEAMGAAVPAATTHAAHVNQFGIEFPIVAVAIGMEVAGTGLSFNAKETNIGSNTFSGSWVRGSSVGMQIGDRANPPS